MTLKDFNVKVTVRNNRLLSLIEEKFGTSAEMCRQIDISPSKVAAYMTMKQKPVGKSGWKKCAIDLSTALGVHPDEIWPQHLQNVVLKTSTAEMHLDSDEVRQIASGATFDQAEARDLILKMAKGLPDRYYDFLCWRITDGQNTSLQERGEYMGVSRERLRQIECKIHRHMRVKAYRLGVVSIGEPFFG